MEARKKWKQQNERRKEGRKEGSKLWIRLMPGMK